MKKNSIAVILVILAAVGILWIIIYYKNSPATPPLDNPHINAVAANTNSEIRAKTVSLVIDYGGENVKTFTMEYKKGMTAYDVLDVTAQKEKITIKTKKYDAGIFIEAIGDKKGGTDNRYWLYYVNEKSPSVASDKKIIQAEDTVKFKFEKSPF